MNNIFKQSTVNAIVRLHLSNQNFQFYCATIAYHVGLNAESNHSVEGLQLRLEDMSIFLDFEVID